MRIEEVSPPVKKHYVLHLSERELSMLITIMGNIPGGGEVHEVVTDLWDRRHIAKGLAKDIDDNDSLPKTWAEWDNLPIFPH